MNNNYYCIIMAGGMGRRFWPYSRKALPKQFLDFFGTGQTLLQQTFDRYKKIIPTNNIYITTHKDYKQIVLDLLPEITEGQLIIEEERRNTAPSIAYASHIIQKINPDATIVVAPSDHLILKVEEFKEAILKGLEFASKNDKLVTLGIKPKRPETGYGYIQMKAFHEMMSEICPRVECDVPDFTSCPNISIDYSIMEKADNVYVQLCDFGWADLGTWDALYDASPKDTNHNVIINSNTVLYNCKDSIILVPEGQLAVVQDLDGYLVASRDNVLLICKKDDHDAIRKFVNDVEMKFGEKYS